MDKVTKAYNAFIEAVAEHIIEEVDALNGEYGADHFGEPYDRERLIRVLIQFHAGSDPTFYGDVLDAIREIEKPQPAPQLSGWITSWDNPNTGDRD